MQRGQQPAQIQRLGGYLAAVALLPQVAEQLGQLHCPLLLQRGEAAAQQLLQILVGDNGHVHHHEAADQRLVQLAGTGVAVVHGADEPCGIVQLDALVAGHIDDPPVIQRGVQHGQRLVLGHVHLVQHAEAALPGAGADGTLAEHHLSVLQRVRADQRRRVHIDVHGHIPHGTAEHRRQIFRQHVLAGGLGTGQQHMLTAQQRRRRALPYLPAVVEIPRRRHAGGGLLRQRVRRPEAPYFLQQPCVHALVL